jgi:hypothetical protein
MYYVPDGPSRASPPRAVNWPVSYPVCLGWPRSNLVSHFRMTKIKSSWLHPNPRGPTGFDLGKPSRFGHTLKGFSFPVYPGQCILYTIICDELCQSNRVWNTFWWSRRLSQIWLEMKYENFKKKASVYISGYILKPQIESGNSVKN